MLDVETKLDFNGSFCKAYEEDENRIDDFSASIFFYKNGQVFLKTEQEIFEKIVKKVKRDTEPYEQYPTYKDDYRITGTTSEGRKLSAITRYHLIYSDEISLNDVTLGNTLELNEKHIIEARYCLANCPVSLKISTLFLNYENGFILTYNGSIFDSQNQKIRISTMILKNPNGMPEEEYKNYSTWFELIFSFASGHNVEEIYSVKIFKLGNSIQELEYWSGEGYSYSKASGIKVIERLDEFICKAGSAVNYENFDQKGLGTALGWYVDCFNTTFAPTRFIILCTILETLSQKCLVFFKGEYTESEQIKKAIFEALEQEDIKKILDAIEEEKQSLKKETLQKDDEFRQKLKDALKTLIDKHLSHSQKQILIENEYYNKIKNKIIDVFNETKDKINDEKMTKYDICKQKIEQAFKGEFDNFNKPTFASKIN